MRQVSNHLLKDLFETNHHEFDLPWDDLMETEVESIFCAWQDLPEADCRAIEIILHEISDMAAGDEGMRAIYGPGKGTRKRG